MMRNFIFTLCSVLALLLVHVPEDLGSQGVVIPTNLHDSVPYQGDTLLVNPLPMNVHDADQAYLDCDWVTLMSMIRDLEERIATALEVDTVYDVYVSGQVVGTSIFMHYDCVVLRDSIISLQIELDEALLGPPTVLSQDVLDIAQRVATVKAKITDDGGAPVRLWGVLFGKQTWWNDSLGFFELDSLNSIGDGTAPTSADDYSSLMDTALAQNWYNQIVAFNGGSLTAMPAAMDTASMMQDSIMLTTLTGLDRYTQYIAIPIAANDSLMTEFDGSASLVDGAELNFGPLGWYGMGDTLMFTTLPDTASGFTLDTANVLQNSARLIFTVSDAGGQGPDSAGFFYDTQDFTTATFAGDSIASDSTGGTTHTAELTGLTRYTDYYFRGYADNLAGRGRSDSSFTFKTLPDIPTFDTVYYSGTVDSLVAVIDDNGGVAPSSHGFKYAEADATLASTAAATGALVGDVFSAQLLESNLTAGQQYHVVAHAGNVAGTGYSDTVMFATRPGVTTNAATVIGENALTINGRTAYAQALATGVGFQWGTSPTLANASDTSVVEQSDSTFMAALTGLMSGARYYFAANATNAGGTKTGDTLSTATLVTSVADSLLKLPPLSYDNKYKFMGTASFGNAVPTDQSVIFSYEPDLTDSTVAGAALVNTYSLQGSWNDLQPGAEIHFFFEVTNEAGTSRSDTLQVFTYLGVDTEAATVNTDSSLQLNGSVRWADSIAMPTSVGFNWGIASNLADSQDTIVQLASDSSITAMLSGLQGGTKYYFEAVGTNIAGEEQGDILYGATRVGIISDSVYQSADPYDAYQGFVVMLDFDNAPPTSQILKWSYSSTLQDSVVHAMTLVNPGGSARLDLRDGSAVLPGAEYHFQYQFTNEGGVTASDTLQAFTLVQPVTEEVSVLTDSTSALNARFIWTHESAKPDSVGFAWSTDETFPDSTSSDTTFAFSSLGIDSALTVVIPSNFGEHYFVKAKAVNASGTSFGRVNTFCSIVCPETLDYAGSTYDIVQIGCDCVFEDNLQTRVYASGDSIPSYVLDSADTRALWAGSEVGAMVELTDAELDSTGGFYSAQSVLDDGLTYKRALCPAGWSVLPNSRFNTSSTYSKVFSKTEWLSWMVDWSDPSAPILPRHLDMYNGHLQIYSEAVLDSLYLAGQPFNNSGYGNNESGLSFVRNGHYRKNGSFNGSGSPISAILLTQVYYPWSNTFGVVYDSFGSSIESDLDALPGPMGSYTYAGNIRCIAQIDSVPIVYASNREYASATEVTLKGHIAHNGWRTLNHQWPIDEAGFVWSLNEDFSDSTVVVVSVSPSDSISTTLTGLTEGEEYWFKAYAVNVADTGFSEPERFVAALPSLPVVRTDSVKDLVVDKFSKEWHRLTLTLEQDGNSPLLSAGWKWSTNPNLTDGDDTTQVAGYHSGVESLLLGADSTFQLEMGQQAAISSSDWIPGTTYYYAAFVTNEVGTNWGDTLEIYVPAAIQVGKTTTSNYGATVEGLVHCTDNNPLSLSVVWSTSSDLVTRELFSGTDVLTLLIDSLWCPAVAAYDSAGGSMVDLAGYNLDCDSTTAYTEEVFLHLLEDMAQYVPESFYSTSQSASLFFLEYAIQLSMTFGLEINQDALFDMIGMNPESFSIIENLPIERNVDEVVGAKMDQMLQVMDSVAVTLAADSTFHVELSFGDTLPVGTEIYFQVVVDHGGRESRSSVNFFTTGACLPVEFDGYSYPTQKFQDECWFIENLRTEVNANGDSIPYTAPTANPSEWTGTLPRQSYKDESSLSSFGRYYNEASIVGLCPTGTHVATYADWYKLISASSFAHSNTIAQGLGGLFGGGSDLWPRGNLSIFVDGEYYDVDADSPASLMANSAQYWRGTAADGKNISGFNAGGDWQWMVSTLPIFNDPAKYDFGYWSNGGLTPGSPNPRIRFLPGEGMYIYYEVSQYDNSIYAGHYVRCVVDDPLAAATIDDVELEEISLSTLSLRSTWDSRGIMVLPSDFGFLISSNADLSNAQSHAASGLGDTITATIDLTGYNEGEVLYYAAYVNSVLGADTTAIKSATVMNCIRPSFDGYTYDIAVIGNQCWFAENLRSDNYADGSPIPGGLDNATWASATEGAQAIYNGDSAMWYADYGRLYNWYAVDSAAGLCPTGWHVPTDGEFTTYTDFLGGEIGTAEKMKSSAADTPAWNGTNSSGWSGLPGGYRGGNGASYNAGNQGGWWSSTPSGSSARYRSLFGIVADVARLSNSQRIGYSVRCLRDTASAPVVATSVATSLTDSTATLNATINFDGWSTITATGFKWGYEADLSDAVDVAGDTLAGAFSADLTGLVANDTVYFSAFATNALGTSYGDTLSLVAVGCSSVNFDGYNYEVVEIGDQCWFAENLRTEHYANGDTIPANFSYSEWLNTTSDAVAVYGENGGCSSHSPDGDACDPTWSLNEYGRLYNWYAVDDARGLCPTGWHVPTDGEWMTLEMELGMSESEANNTGWRGTDQGTQMKTTYGWYQGNNGTNSSGFSILPSGFRNTIGGYANAGKRGYWWSSSPSAPNAWIRYLDNANTSVHRDDFHQRHGLSVRCLRD